MGPLGEMILFGVGVASLVFFVWYWCAIHAIDQHVKSLWMESAKQTKLLEQWHGEFGAAVKGIEEYMNIRLKQEGKKSNG